MTDRSNTITQLLKEGYVLFPLAPNSKRPPANTTGHLSWSQVDSLDYEEELKDVTNNVGIVTGKKSGIVVVDIDPDHGGTFEALEGVAQTTIFTREHGTRSGGTHLLFRYPDGVDHIGLSVGKLAPGIDVRADGGYIVAPTSQIDGAEYTLRHARDLQELPARILARLLPVDREVPESHYQYPSDQYEDVLRWHKANVRDAANAMEGERDDTAYRLLVRSFQLAQCVPDEILSQNIVIRDFTSKLPYQLKGLGGKVDRAWAFAEVTPRPHPQAFVTPHTAPIETREGPPVMTLDTYTPNSTTNPAQFNDAGNADRLVELHGEVLRYVEGLGWLIWDGKVWRPEQESSASVIEMISVAHAFMWEDYNQRVANQEPGAKALYAHAQYSLSLKGIMNAMNLLKSRHSVRLTVEDLDKHNHLLCVNNGVVNLRTGMLQAHDPMLHMTRLTDINYDPSAEAPRWTQFIDEVMPDMPDMPEFLQRLVGYGITGEVSEHAMAIHYGRGSNGKSIFLDTLRTIFRSISTVTDWSSFERKANGAGGARPDLVRLRGSRLVTVNEADARASIDEAQIKRMASGDMITARGLHQNEIEFAPNFLLQMATNAKPDIRGADEGIWRRVKLIPWTRFFAPDERDHTLGATLLTEREGILSWAVRGAVEWYASGLQEPVRVRNATKEYREAADILGGFIDAEEHGGWLVPEENKRVPSAWTFTLYKVWAGTQGYSDRDMLSQKAFKAALEERGVNTKRTKEGVMYLGLAANMSVQAVRTHGQGGQAKVDVSNGMDEAQVREMF